MELRHLRYFAAVGALTDAGAVLLTETYQVLRQAEAAWLAARGAQITGGESERFCAAFPDNRVKHPYDILFGDGEYTAFVTSFTGTFTAPLELPTGTAIQPTGKAFAVVFSTIARWRDGKIVEEYLMYDNASFMQQIGLA